MGSGVMNFSPFNISGSGTAVTSGGSLAFTGTNTHAGTETFNNQVVLNGQVVYGPSADTYAASQVTSFAGSGQHTLALSGNITSWATSNRTPGTSLHMVIKSSPDGTFTGAATGRYDPYTGAGPNASGMGRFPQPTVNLLAGMGLSSEDFMGSGWTKTSATIGVNLPGAPLAPNGSGRQVQKLVEDTTNGVHYLSLAIPGLVVGSPAGYSVFVWPDQNRTEVLLSLGSTGTCFYALTGAGNVGAAYGGVTGTIHALPGGGYRCDIHIAALFGNTGTGIYIASSASVVSYQGDGVSGVFIWGAQPELSGTGATGYNPTGTSLVGQGLLIEQGASNLLTANQSNLETGTTGYSSFTGATISQDLTTAWQGAASLKIVTPGVANQEGTQTTVNATVTGGATYTLSAWVKGSGNISLVLGDGYANSTLNVTLTSAWTRISITKTVNAGATSAFFYILTNGIQAITFYADGFQFETGSFATSWTLGGGTRGAETFVIPASASPTTGGAVFVDFYLDGDAALASPASAHYLCDLRSPAALNGVTFLKNAGAATWSAYLFDGTTNTSITSGTLTPAVGRHRAVVRWSSASFEWWQDGILIASAATPAHMPAAQFAGMIGASYAGASQWDQAIYAFGTFTADPGSAAAAAYSNIHDPSVLARVSAAASYFIDFGSVSSANGGNLAPSRVLTPNPAWSAIGTTAATVTLYSGKTGFAAFDCFGANESNVVFRWNQAA